MYTKGLSLLRQMLGPEVEFRPGQWEAIETVAVRRKRALVVQRTGWGKSIVYFLATRLLREQGAGPSLLISPLLSLMRNQIEMAARIGIRAHTINSANTEEWEAVESALTCDGCDLLLISPERLNNDRFLNQVLPRMTGSTGLFVVDEAHCISDWGHDFRPDYRRIVRILNTLPAGVPVLGTTATANDRVIADVRQQLGPELTVLRGPLARPSLRLQNLRLDTQSERLAWLAENLGRLPGSGIIYCLTIADVERVAGWLAQKGFSVAAYHAGNDQELDRPALEQTLLKNEIKALVATVALGMGFDKPDLGFVIHFQRPGSVVAYYQQVGRAGRAVNRAYGILLNGLEDDEIQDYFIESAFPSATVMQEIIGALESVESLTFNEILARVNVNHTMAERALKLLEIDGAVGAHYERARRYFRTPNPWQPDVARVERISELRRTELEQMRAYVAHTGCLMEFLTRALDDPAAGPCGVCANCQGRGFRPQVSASLIAEAVNFLRGEELILEPRRVFPAGLFPGRKSSIPVEERNQAGRALCYYGDAGWGRQVREGKYTHGRFDDDLVQASAELVRTRWNPEPFPEWVTAIPSRRHPKLVYTFAARLAEALGLPFHPVLERTADAPEQKKMENRYSQARNVADTLSLSSTPHPGPVLLVDDVIDSGWTLTLAGWLLRTHGSGPVFPFVLARASARKKE